MSDMLAALLGAGGGKGAHVSALVSAGKSDTKQTPIPAGTADPFMEVLFARLNSLSVETDGSAGVVVEAVDGALPLQVQAGENADAGGPNPLENALLRSQADPADAAIQAILAAPMAVTAIASEPRLVRPSAEANSPGLALGGAGEEVMGGAELDLPAQALPATTGRGGATPNQLAAESAAAWQALPAGEEGGKAIAASLHLDPNLASTAADTASMSVAQSLAAQFREVTAEVGGRTGDLTANGLGQTSTPQPGAAAGMSAEAAIRPASPGMHLSVEAHLRSPAFPQELGERIVWLSSRQGQFADIALNPPHLGPLEVKLSLVGGEAGAQFFSPHPQVRDAIEAALPRLREMMAEAGVTLGQAQVRDEAFSRQEAYAQGKTGQDAGQGEHAEPGPRERVTASGLGRAGLGLVDLYI